MAEILKLKKKKKKNLQIIEELGRNKNTCNEKSMNVEGINMKIGRMMIVKKAMKINISSNKATWTTVCILEDPLQVTLYGNAWS